MLVLDDLHKRYGDVAALAGATFQLSRGQLLGFLGPNGAGKTTAMRSVFGLVAPDAGTVTWDGQPVGAPERLRFGYMPEQRGLYPRMRVRAQLVYFGKLHGMAAEAAGREADRWLAELGLTDRASSRLEELSHGNQQRIQLAVALVHDPELLVLDEPFSGLDPLGVETMAQLLREISARNVAVMFSSHQLDLVEDLCEDVVIIHNGAVVLNGAVRELRNASPNRYLELETTAPTGWLEETPGVRLLSRDQGRVRVEIDDTADLVALAEQAVQRGDVTRFSFEPPNLSQVFREAVQQ